MWDIVDADFDLCILLQACRSCLMSRQTVRVTTRVSSTGEVVVVVEPIIAADRRVIVVGEDRNRVSHVGSRTEERPC